VTGHDVDQIKKCIIAIGLGDSAPFMSFVGPARLGVMITSRNKVHRYADDDIPHQGSFYPDFEATEWADKKAQQVGVIGKRFAGFSGVLTPHVFTSLPKNDSEVCLPNHYSFYDDTVPVPLLVNFSLTSTLLSSPGSLGPWYSI
jgi:hypothetical protein